jgi:hypothetical protein
VTSREIIKRKKRQLDSFVAAGFALMVFGVVLTKQNDTFAAIAILGFGLAFAGVMLSFHLIKCPRCGKKLGNTARGGLFQLSKEFKYCPFCGVDIDTTS